MAYRKPYHLLCRRQQSRRLKKEADDRVAFLMREDFEYMKRFYQYMDARIQIETPEDETVNVAIGSININHAEENDVPQMDLLTADPNVEFQSNFLSADTTNRYRELNWLSQDEIENLIRREILRLHNDSENYADSNLLFRHYTVDNRNFFLDLPEDNDDDDESFELLENVRNWAIGVNTAKVNEILDILRKLGHDVPKDCRTLLQTPRKTTIKSCSPGHYFHYGLEKALKEEIDRYNIKDEIIPFHLGLDGLVVTGLHSSKKKCAWPILGKILRKHAKPFVAACYVGNSKPDLADDFLNEFIDEYIELSSNGFLHNGRRYKCKIRCVICDAPARCFVKCIKQYNGKFGCDKCTEEGYHEGYRRLFDKHTMPVRTNESFRNREQPGHHKTDSPFERIHNLDMTDAFALEPMHLAHMGSTKILISHLIRLSNDKIINIDINKLNETLISFSEWVPLDFSRKTESIFKLGDWKATMFRHFLQYDLIALANSFLPDNYVKHIFHFVCGIRLLSDPLHYKKNNACAKELIEYFVHNFANMYGQEYLIYSIHALVHLPDDALRNGPLESFSAYPFENFMKTLRDMVIHKPQHTLQQLHRRLVERSRNVENVKEINYPIPKLPNHHQLPFDCFNGFSKLIFEDFTLTTELPNNVCVLKDSTFFVIKFFAYTYNFATMNRS